MSEPSLDLYAKPAYDAIAPLLATIDPATTPPYTLDAVHAVAQARTTARNLEPFRARIAALPEFDMGHLDRLPQYAAALHYVHTALLARDARVRAMPELAKEGFQLRALLLAYAELLAVKGTFQTQTVARLRDGSGYHDLVDDLSTLVMLYGERPEVVGDGTPVTRAEVQRANELVQAMADALGLDKSELVTHDELAKNRQKIAHLLTTAQRQLRRAMAYLRFEEGDAAAFVPTLYTPNKSRGKGAEPTLADVHDQLHAEDHAGGHAHPDDNPFTDGV